MTLKAMLLDPDLQMRARSAQQRDLLLVAAGTLGGLVTAGLVLLFF